LSAKSWATNSPVKPGDRVVVESVMDGGECLWCRLQKCNLCPHLFEVRTKGVSRAYAMNPEAIRSSSNGVPASTLNTVSAPSTVSTRSPRARACRLRRS
jgi:threonine dehydrogenase-like Zn-dependent dehydrogenase